MQDGGEIETGELFGLARPQVRTLGVIASLLGLVEVVERGPDDPVGVHVGLDLLDSLELALATSVSRYDARPQVNLDLRSVADTDTALEVLIRYLNLVGQPPYELRFSTERMPDLDRGMVFTTSSDLDDLRPFTVPGTDGSWASKNFVVVNVVQNCKDSVQQDVVAFYVPASGIIT